MPERLLIRNARVFDSRKGALRARCRIVIEGERIVAVSEEPIEVGDVARDIDAAGRVVLPGLIDAHVHVVAASHDLMNLALAPPSLVSAQSSRIMRDMLHRGFTTVRRRPRCATRSGSCGSCRSTRGEEAMKKTVVLPSGWTEQQVRDVLEHYENQTDAEAVAEHEAALAPGAHRDGRACRAGASLSATHRRA
jgi:imidazolonepropionase-like amidohydrolase